MCYIDGQNNKYSVLKIDRISDKSNTGLRTEKNKFGRK
jgi:hypothetical protein